MNKIFTKIKLGDMVTAVGGRCFRKLSTENVEPTSGIRLVTADGYILTDNNGTILTVMEDK